MPTRHFDRLAARYTELRASAAYADPLTDEVVSLAELRGRRVLDVGCGTGTVVCRLAREYGCEVVGVDPSLPMIDVARREAGECGEFCVARAEALPYEDGEFDAALMRLVVHHLDRPKAFAELRRVLRPHGRLAITTTDPVAFETIWMRDFFPSYVAIEQSRCPDGQTLAAELVAAGFASVSVTPYTAKRRFTRDLALEKLRGRAYSILVEIGDDEYEAGVAAAEAALPDEVEYELGLLNVVAMAPG